MEYQFSVWITKEKIIVTNFEPHQRVRKIGTNKSKAYHSNSIVISIFLYSPS